MTLGDNMKIYAHSSTPPITVVYFTYSRSAIFKPPHTCAVVNSPLSSFCLCKHMTEFYIESILMLSKLVIRDVLKM